MKSERPASACSAPPQRVVGTALGASTEHVFEVADARRLSLEVTFSNDPTPHDGEVFAQVMVRVGASVERVQLGRCRFEEQDASAELGRRDDGAHPHAPREGGSQAHRRRSGRIVPIDTPIDCLELLRHGRVVSLEQGFDQLPLLFARKQAIAPEFSRYTADLVYDLRIYRSLFDDVDAGLVRESATTRAEVERVVLDGQGRRFMRFFDERLIALDQLVRNFSRQEHERHGFYFRRHVWDAIISSPFLSRTNLRPRGYAGDSVMMQYIYENEHRGESTFGKLMHKHPIESAAAQAVRNRRALVAETIVGARRDAKLDPGARLRFMSVACGPAWEVADLFATPEDCDAYECTLLDQDAEALGEARQRIDAVAWRTGCPVHANYVRESVRTMLRTRDPADVFGRYHVVYSMGLFDYLTAPVAKAVLGQLYALLVPGGRMLIGNFHVGNPTRWYMDYWMDWTLIHRTEEDLLALACELPGARAAISFEETASQMFLSVEKAST